jgi:gluconolactonase
MSLTLNAFLANNENLHVQKRLLFRKAKAMKALYALSLAVLLAGCSNAPAPAPVAESHGVGNIVRLDPAFDALVPKDAQIEKVGGGFEFTEGPLWRPDGQLWFSDVTGNVVRSITPAGQVTVLIPKGGGETNAPAGSFIGPNAMVADKDGYVLLCQHTNRRIGRVAKDLKITPYLEKFEGKRFNSPNDLVYRSDGALYFTDPPYGLQKQDDDPAKELKFNGVFRYAGGKLTAVIRDLNRPNGLAFSPDEKTFYVANSDEKKRIWMKYDVQADGSVSNGKVFADVTAEKEEGVPDGMKVDSQGNIWSSGPAGIWVFSPDGKHMGTLKTPEIPANCGWGDDGKTLYITARTSVYRIKLAVAGEKPLYQVYQ